MLRVLPITAVAVPKLDEIVSNPERAIGLPPDIARALSWKCLTVLTALQVAASQPATCRPSTTAEEGERLLTVADVALRIGMSVSWVEKHTADLPARVSVAGNPRWRESDIERWIKNRPEYGKS